MKTKRTAIILIAVAFMMVVILSTVGLFSVKKVHVDFEVSAERDVSDVKESLNSFVGVNLLFFDTDRVFEKLKEENYLEVVSVDKQFPNVVNVKIKERRAIYYVKNQEEYYLMTADGFVLDKSQNSPVSRDRIGLLLEGVTLESVNLGETLKTSDDTLMQKVFAMAKSVNLTDCIKTITVKKMASEQPDVIFETYTGVKIEVSKADDLGVEKVVAGFNAYDNRAEDYEKMFSIIKVFKNSNGQIEVDWSEN